MTARAHPIRGLLPEGGSPTGRSTHRRAGGRNNTRAPNITPLSLTPGHALRRVPRTGTRGPRGPDRAQRGVRNSNKQVKLIKLHRPLDIIFLGFNFKKGIASL